MSELKMEAIPFFRPTVTTTELEYISSLTRSPNRLGEKDFSKKVIEILSGLHGRETALAKSCTQALELAAMLCRIQPGDEVIMPSFSFVSCANAFVSRGARITFVDVRPDTMNIDERLIEAAVTAKTKAILTVNYSGVGCEYDSIQPVAKANNLLLVEDNAHGIFAKYKGKMLGTFGDVSVFSFDHLKNITCGQGGAVRMAQKMMSSEFEYYCEFGTNKVEFQRGESPNYEWKSLGSNFYLPEILAAFLLAQLEDGEAIIARFRSHWNAYTSGLKDLEAKGIIGLSSVPSHCEHNAHNFFIKTKDGTERGALMAYLKSEGIHATFHYVPLHSSEFGKKVGRFHGEDKHTTKESERLLRLPLYYDLTADDIDRVCSRVYQFYGVKY